MWLGKKDQSCQTLSAWAMSLPPPVELLGLPCPAVDRGKVEGHWAGNLHTLLLNLMVQRTWTFGPFGAWVEALPNGGQPSGNIGVPRISLISLFFLFYFFSLSLFFLLIFSPVFFFYSIYYFIH